jgi:tetratricopeptide (TPR) repeat protein
MLDIVAEGKGDSEHGLSLLWLAQTDLWRGDELACAKRIDDGVELIAILPIGFSRWRVNGGSTRLNGLEAIDYTRAEAQWHYLRAAHNQHDAAMVRKHGEKLATLAPDDVDIVADAAPILLAFGMHGEVEKLFARPYVSLQHWLNAKPDDPARMNSMAWLCARCQQHLPEALELATAATKQRPNDPQLLDTLAEVHFAMGERDEAIRIETRALELAPNHPFYKFQLDRFGRRP